MNSIQRKILGFGLLATAVRVICPPSDTSSADMPIIGIKPFWDLDINAKIDFATYGITIAAIVIITGSVALLAGGVTGSPSSSEAKADDSR